MMGFDHIDTWVFDLDNTLYPASCKLFDQMHKKMSAYVMRHFNLDFANAYALQKKLYHRHGTTLRGLMVEYDHKPEGFLEEVHDIDYTTVPHSPALLAALESLPGRKLVFTAGTHQHARRTMERLGVSEVFDGVFDIVDALHIPKPAQAPYEKFLKDHAVTPISAVMFEDISRNLEVPHQLGMTTVLVTSAENEDGMILNGDTRLAHVHHTTDDLTKFLQRLS